MRRSAAAEMRFRAPQPPTTELRPLFRALPPAPEFPIDALLSVGPAAEAIHARTQAPVAMCAQAVLAAATLAVQAHHDVEVPGAGRRPLTGLFATVAESGERKSSVDRAALAPAHQVEEAWRADYEAQRSHWANDHAAWQCAREAAKRKGKGDRGAIRTALAAIGEEPMAPPHPMLLIADPTTQAIVRHLEEVRGWGGVFAAEGGLVIGGHSFRDENRMATGAMLNALWDGDPIRQARVGTGRSFLPGRRVTVHVMMQPVAAAKLFSDPLLDGLGTLARFLVVAPESTAGLRLYREAPAETETVLAAYRHRLAATMLRPPRMLDGSRNALDPAPLPLSIEARAVWVAFHDHIERSLGEGGRLAPIRAWGAKAPEHAARLAAVLTVIADPEARAATREAMDAAVMLVQHYAAEMLRLAGAAEVDPALRLAERLLNWWRTSGGTRKHLAAIYDGGPRAIRSADKARAVVAVLEEHGHVRRLPAGTFLDGMPRREAWELVG
ncbi:YfjI family protein [Elioraea sp.]|uniref:YfjI family protein n=1 Tax=Elioraea sp. TaxID=2185103 RepID=UPI003F704B5E